MSPARPCTSMVACSRYDPTDPPRRARSIWQWWGNMLCDGAVTHAFDAVPDGSTPDGADGA